MKKISFNHRIRLDIDGKRQTLIIQKARLEDAATYSCRVRDQTCSAELIVEDILESDETKEDSAHTVTFTDELSYRYFEKGEEEEKQDTDEPTSLSYSTTSTSWMREAEVDPIVSSYTKHTLIGRNEYFFRIWHYANTLFK